MAMTQFPKQLTEQEMKDNQVPIQWRDRCAALSIPLNKCRRETSFLPWKCTQSRHDYEECEYLDFQRRVAEYKNKTE